MSNSPSLPHAGQIDIAVPSQTTVYNLTILIRHTSGQEIIARAANLDLEEFESTTVRDALSGIVAAAKQLIQSKLTESEDIPWIAPPHSPKESESRFVVPLHL